MKKITTILTSIFISIAATSSFSAVKFGNAPKNQSNGKYFVGKIIAASYFIEPNTGSQAISIFTKADSKLNENNLINAGMIEFTDKDVQMGMILAASIGKDIAVGFDANYSINVVSIVTEEFWNGSKK